jgi:mRNA interferase RelE/StbE
MATYTVRLSKHAAKAVSKLDVKQRQIISKWIEKNLEDCANPRAIGKPLTGDLSELWRYRVGSYRLLAKIYDDVVLIEIINIGHRSTVYQKGNRHRQR